MSRQFGAGSQQRLGFGAGAQPGPFGAGGMSGGGVRGSALEPLRERIAQNLRERVVEDLRERLESLVKERVESTQRERLGGALRAAVAEQIALGGGFDAGQIAETVGDWLADPICENIAHGIRERLGEVLRERVTDTVRNAVLQSAMGGGDTAASGAMTGLH